MISDTQTQISWWGNFKLDHNQSKQWIIGPLSLIVRHLDGEWQIAYERLGDFDSDTSIVEISDTDQLPATLGNNSRYVFRITKGLLTVMPMLADRPIIARPQTPFNLTAGEEVTLYISSPVWIELAVGTPTAKTLESIAIQRPSDTWFGPSTLEGELCYASTTHCRMDFTEICQRPHRAITPVLIRNQADTTLAIERVKLPTPLLPVYSSSDGQLWTSKITLVREKDGDMAELFIDDKPPKEIENSTLLRKPRDEIDNTILIRAFNAVFN